MYSELFGAKICFAFDDSVSQRACGRTCVGSLDGQQLWQVMPVHLKGIPRLLEFTAFPLTPGDDGIPLVLGHLFPLEDVGLAPAALKQEITVDTAIEFLFIDIGAGQPHWPAEAA